MLNFPSTPTNGQIFTTADGSAWQWDSTYGSWRALSVDSRRAEYAYTATAGQTVFSATYTPGFIDVYLNGVRLVAADYTATNGTSVTLSSAAALDDSVVIVVPETALVSNSYTQAQTDALFDAVDAELPNYRPVSLGSQAASGANIDFTAIPSWATKITIIFREVSTNATGSKIPAVRLGTEDGFVASGYLGAASTNGASTVVTAQNVTTGGFSLFGNAPAAAGLVSGKATLTKGSGNYWMFDSMLARSDATTMYFAAGSISLAKALNSIRLTTSDGTDSYDAGEFTAYYE